MDFGGAYTRGPGGGPPSSYGVMGAGMGYGAPGVPPMPGAPLAQRAAPNLYGQPGDEALLRKLNKWDAALAKKWPAWRRQAREEYDVTAGHQWPDEAIEALQEEDETASPAVFNSVDPMVSAISGAEITNRQQVQYSPRELGDAGVNELYTGAADWCRDECDAGDEESQAFRDTLICGLGCTETRMDYETDQAGMSVVDRIDVIADKIEVDTAARKANYVDAKYDKRTRRYDKEEARTLFPALFEAASSTSIESDGGPHINNPETRYDPDAKDKTYGDTVCGDDEIEIMEYQWKELVPITFVVDPTHGGVQQFSAADVQKFREQGIDVRDPRLFNSATINRTVWKRAFRAGDRVQVMDLPDEEFTKKYITGKFDRKTGMPYGVVRAMIDPQRWSNKFMLQMDRIFGKNAKGGILMEEGATEDQNAFEESWAGADTITTVADGAISNNKIQPKPAPPFPAIADRLLQIANNAVAQVTGVNREMLGISDRDQPIGLEYQRKQAAYGVLAVFFDSLRRYRKLQGRLLLKHISKYMADNRLVRITGENGLERYVPLVHDPATARFDVIVDEAPAGPNQVERTWATFVQGAPMIKGMLEMGMPPEVIFAILEYSPFPKSFVDKLRSLYTQMQQQAAQQPPNPQQQLQMAAAQAGVQKTQGEAARAAAQAEQAHTEAQLAPQRVLLDARDQVLNFQQAAMNHQGQREANLMRFAGPARPLAPQPYPQQSPQPGPGGGF